MRIVVIRHSIRNRGGDKLVLDYLSWLIKQGHTVVYWTNEVNTSFPFDNRIQIKAIPYKGVLGTIVFSLLTRIEGDVLLVDLAVMALFASLRNRTKVLYLAQDYDISYHRFWLTKFFVGWCYRFVLHYLRIMTVSVSQGLAEKLQQYGPQALITISNGVDLKFFSRNPSDLLGTNKPWVVLLFARKDHRKGLDIGIKALEYLHAQQGVPDWEVWTIGTEKVDLAGIKVKHLGFLDSDAKLKQVLDGVDIYLVPSRSEGLSLLLLQALACECVVVSTEASSIIENEVNGLISPIEDAGALAENLCRVMKDVSLFLKLRNNARQLANRFDFEKSCEQFQKTLIEFVEKNAAVADGVL